MPSQIGRLKWLFVAIFFTLSMAVTAWQWIYIIPRQKCDTKGWWWSERDLKCYQPMRIVDMPATGQARFRHRLRCRPASNQPFPGTHSTSARP